MNIYEKTFSVTCPNDGDEIEYTLIIESNKIIMVEDINASMKSIAHAYQEDIADAIRTRLSGRQTITATHQGVKVTTVRGVGLGSENREKLQKAIKKAYFRYGLSSWEGITDDVIKAMK